MRARCILVFFVSIFISVSANADTGSSQLMSELSEGMTYGEVLKAWGAPNEKIEQESKRKDIWLYDDSRVNFVDGQLVSIESTEGARVALKEEADEISAAKPASDIAVSDILNEIMDSTK